MFLNIYENIRVTDFEQYTIYVVIVKLLAISFFVENQINTPGIGFC